MKIIGLSGKKKSGKDTVYRLAGEYLKKHYKAKAGRVAFADPLKHEVSEITGFTLEFIEKHKDELRSLLQVWGADFRRAFNGSDYWINKMRPIVEQSADHYDVLFITDCRFKNEVSYIKEIGGTLVKVERRESGYPEPFDVHSSENDLNNYGDYDYILNNDKTKEELTRSVSQMLETLNILKNAS
tara:strand:- start:16295 stop:16849 length:555 start_codon:yes stop_codon:yes gene_type:complete